jgi:hypothetical protein
MLRRFLATIAALCLLAVPVLAQPEPPRRTFLPQLTNGPTPTVIVSPNMVVILAVGPRATSDPAASQQVVLRNETSAPIYLGGWTIRNALQPLRSTFTFPAYSLPAGRTIIVASGPRPSRPADGFFAWGVPAPIWQTGDVAELLTADGQRVSWLVVPSIPTPPTVPPSPTAITAPGSSVEINDVVLRDSAFPNESEEYVQIRNASEKPVTLAGWRLLNATRPGQVPAYVFPSFNLGVDVTVAVFSAVGDDELDVGDFYWDQTVTIWQVGDRAELRDPQGNLIDTLIVPNQ